jgi:hypothetical protein
VSIAFSSPGRRELSVAGFEVVGHLLLEDLLKDGLYALADPGLHVQLHVVLEVIVLRGQVVSLLTQPTTYQTLSFLEQLIFRQCLRSLPELRVFLRDY